MSTGLPDFSGADDEDVRTDTQDQAPAAAPEAAPVAKQDAAPATPPAAAEPAQPGSATPAPTAEQAAAGATQADAEQAAAMNVPLATFLDMRDRANAAELEAKRLREWRQQQEQQSRRQAPPDPSQDPEGYQDFQNRQFAQRMHQQTLFVSQRMAEITHGKDVVTEAYKWGEDRCDSDPVFNMQVARSQDPVEFVVSEWKKSKFLDQVKPDDYQAFLAWKASQGQGGQPPAPNPTPQPAPGAPALGARPPPPRQSLAAAPSAGASAEPAALDGEGTYRSMFGGGT